MDLEPYVETIRHQLESAAELGGEEARVLAARLVAPLESAIRLAVQDALSTAAEEITLELAPGSVELRLRGREPEFVVKASPVTASTEDAAEVEEVLGSVWPPRGPAPEGREGDEAPVARINLRLPDRLKTRVEQAAASEGLSVNAWLVRAAAAGLDRRERVRPREGRIPPGAQRYRGWAR